MKLLHHDILKRNTIIGNLSIPAQYKLVSIQLGTYTKESLRFKGQIAIHLSCMGSKILPTSPTTFIDWNPYFCFNIVDSGICQFVFLTLNKNMVNKLNEIDKSTMTRLKGTIFVPFTVHVKGSRIRSR